MGYFWSVVHLDQRLKLKNSNEVYNSVLLLGLNVQMQVMFDVQ